jgi:hypothetical protein
MRSLLAITLALSLAAPAYAGTTFVLTPIAVEGDSAASIARITTIDNLAVNDGGTWLVEVDTDFADTNTDGLLLRNGALDLREGQALVLPAGSTLDSFDSITLNNAGHSGWNFFLANTGSTTTDSGIFFDANLVLQESFISTSPSFSPGTPYIGFFDAKINDSDQIMVVASIDDPAIATTVDRAMVRLQLTPGGVLVSETVVAKEGDLLPGQTETVFDFGTGPHQSAFNDGGDILYFADLNGVTTADGTIYRNTTLLAQEGSPSPVAGRNYELLSSRGMDLSDGGDVVFKANLDGATTDDEVIIKNGAVFRREGDTLPVIAGSLFTAFGVTSGPVQVDNAGNVLWFGDWDNPDLDKDTALFLNDEIVVAEGEQIGSMVVDEISNGDDAFQLSDDGHWIVFEATLVGGISVAFLVEVIDDTVPVRVSDFAALGASDRIRLEWRVSDPDLELAAVEIERAEAEAGPYAALAAAVLAPAAHMQFEDTTVESGREYWYRLVLAAHDGSRSVVGPVIGSSAALRTALQSAFESADDGTVRVRYSVARAGTPVRLSIHDVRGRTLWTNVETAPAARQFEARWNRHDQVGARVPRGVYFVRMQAGGVQASRKLLVAQP